ncbi:hypothetical protein HAX54_001962, partial [Datura stramonium]|nr:hypothetical protein [Datura stramonium]
SCSREEILEYNVREKAPVERTSALSSEWRTGREGHTGACRVVPLPRCKERALRPSSVHWEALCAHVLAHWVARR